MEQQTVLGNGSSANLAKEGKIEDDEEEFRSCCEDEEELIEREELAKEGPKDELDEFSANIFFKGVSIAEPGLSGIGVIMERSAISPVIQVQKKLDFYVEECVADYFALMDGLLEAQQNNVRRVFAFTNSEILYDQSRRTEEGDSRRATAIDQPL